MKRTRLSEFRVRRFRRSRASRSLRRPRRTGVCRSRVGERRSAGVRPAGRRRVPVEITPSNSPALRSDRQPCTASPAPGGLCREDAGEPRNGSVGKSVHANWQKQRIGSLVEGPMPDEQTIQAMTRETLLQFHDAIHQKSFEDFYGNVSRAWQEQLTLGMLTRTFQGFIDQQPDLTGDPRIEEEFRRTTAHRFAMACSSSPGSYPDEAAARGLFADVLLRSAGLACFRAECEPLQMRRGRDGSTMARETTMMLQWNPTHRRPHE